MFQPTAPWTAGKAARRPLCALLLSVHLCGCASEAPAEAPVATGEPPEAPAGPAKPAASTTSSAVTTSPAPSRPLLGIRGYATTVYEKPSDGSRRLGYLRVGALVPRSPEPVGKRGCQGGWYEIEPRGHVCAGQEATTNLDDPLLRAARKRPDLSKPMPYRYGFVRAVLPLYTRIPTGRQQYEAEFKLQEHLEWFKEHHAEVQTASLGADDVPIDHRGVALVGKRLGELGRRKSSTELSLGELFGGESDNDPIPFWLRRNERLIPNISDFEVPQFATFADRARRHTGLAFVGSFVTGEDSLRRRFAVTTDLRLAPTTKVKPDSASPFHGFEIGGDLKLPLCIVRKHGAQAYRLDQGGATPIGDVPRRTIHRLAGKVRKVDGEKYYQLEDGRWLDKKWIGVAVTPRKWPEPARKGEKWIEIDLSDQILVLWNGQQAEYMTLVSTGRPAIGDWKETTSSPRGMFRIYSKHISATMDADEGASLRLNQQKELKPGDEGYVPSKGDGVYGKTLRRGHGLFKLRDVPYIQYFHKSYALHGSYWHDVFGIARSHGCINLAPVDSHRLFLWTEPQVPDGWHGVRSDQGTTVVIHK